MGWSPLPRESPLKGCGLSSFYFLVVFLCFFLSTFWLNFIHVVVMFHLVIISDTSFTTDLSHV